jgi:hypothetical protein
MLHIDAKNFRALRSFSMQDTGKLSVIIGYNESGKSTLVNLIKFAFTGEAYGCRGKDVAALVSEGESAMSVSVRIGPHLAKRTTTGGDAIKTLAERLNVPVDVFPLLFDSQMCGDGGNKHLLSFLTGVANARFNAFTHFADNPVITPYLDRARSAGQTATKQIVTFCNNQRAACKSPPSPVEPGKPRPAPTDRPTLIAATTAAQQRMTAAETALSGSSTQAAQLAAILNWQALTVRYEEALASTPSQDPLPDRAARVARTAANLNTIEALRMLFAGTPAEGPLREAVTLAAQVAQADQAALATHPRPATLPTPPVLAPDAQALYQEIKDRNLLASIQSLAMQSADMQRTDLAEHTAAKAALAAANDAVRQLDQLEGAWMAYTQAVAEHAPAVKAATDAWTGWDSVSKAVLAAEEEFQKAQGDAFGKRVSELAATLLNGRQLTVDPQRGIFLGNQPITGCSLSTRWRMELAVQAAIALSLRSPLLMIDGADILDIRNRAIVTQFLSEYIVPHFEHVIITATPKDVIEAEKALPASSGATKWILTNGSIAALTV